MYEFFYDLASPASLTNQGTFKFLITKKWKSNLIKITFLFLHSQHLTHDYDWCDAPLTTSSVVAASCPALFVAVHVYSSASSNWTLVIVSIFPLLLYLSSFDITLIPRVQRSFGGGKPLESHLKTSVEPFMTSTLLPTATVRGLSLSQDTSSNDRFIEGLTKS